MGILQFSAKPRSETGKGPARRLRQRGFFPAIVYGEERDPQAVAVNQHDFETLLHQGGKNPLIHLSIEGGSDTQSVIVREIQRHPVSQKLVHADLFRVRLDVKMEFEVRVIPVGVALGVREGGVLETILHTVRVLCLPTEVPGEIEIDVSQLRIRDTIHVGDLKMPEGVTVLDDPEETVLTVVPPRVEEEAPAEEVAEATEEAAAEPEVISGKKEEGEKTEESKG